MSDRPRYVCVHGHFYQPPRENPWLEAVERQDSAAPYHDWNERITAECYEPNGAARILDGAGRIRDLIDNYARISFNFGPTLLMWMRRERTDVYHAILEADRRSAARFEGHGSAMAQAYNHLILPLANRRDKRTQVRWGIEDFRFRFGRDPAGMWLPETAVDVESLELMAEEGIRFTILAPHQAGAVRPPGGEWKQVDEGSLDTGRAYRVPLPSGRDIVVFFYDGAASRAVAFEHLLTDGASFAGRLLAPLAASGSDAPLSHIATDGETYGHHHRHGEMALAFALDAIDDGDDAELVNYGLYLHRHPPEWEVRIVEDTSWSCAHGVGRWREDCGCAIDPGRGWSQAWRGPLRDALDLLRDGFEAPYEEEARAYFDDPWEARDRYIEVLVDRSDDSLDRFLGGLARGPVLGEDRTRALRLLELQRHLVLMYTSCGWFFDDIGGIETVQVLRYAGRVLHVARELFENGWVDDLEERFLERLEDAKSNDLARGNGRDIYRRAVGPARVDLRKAAAHYAVSSIFEEHGDEERIYCYDYRREDLREREVGRAKLSVGRVVVTSRITRHSEHLTFAVLQRGNHDLAGGVRPYADRRRWEALVETLETPFLRNDLTAVIRVLDREFQASLYSLRSLFRDAQLRIVDSLLESSVEEAETTLASLYEERSPLLRFLADLGVPAPAPFAVAAEHVLNHRLARLLTLDPPDLPAVRALIETARASAVPLAEEEAAFAAQDTLERMVAVLHGIDEEVRTMVEVRELVELLQGAGITLDLWRVQNAFWQLLQEVGPLPAEPGRDRARWREELEALAETLRMAVQVE